MIHHRRNELAKREWGITVPWEMETIKRSYVLHASLFLDDFPSTTVASVFFSRSRSVLRISQSPTSVRFRPPVDGNFYPGCSSLIRQSNAHHRRYQMDSTHRWILLLRHASPFYSRDLPFCDEGQKRTRVRVICDDADGFFHNSLEDIKR